GIRLHRRARARAGAQLARSLVPLSTGESQVAGSLRSGRAFPDIELPPIRGGASAWFASTRLRVRSIVETRSWPSGHLQPTGYRRRFCTPLHHDPRFRFEISIAIPLSSPRAFFSTLT